MYPLLPEVRTRDGSGSILPNGTISLPSAYQIQD